MGHYERKLCHEYSIGSVNCHCWGNTPAIFSPPIPTPLIKRDEFCFWFGGSEVYVTCCSLLLIGPRNLSAAEAGILSVSV